MGINNLSHEKLVNLIDDGDNQEVFDEIRSRLENLQCCGNCKKWLEHKCYCFHSWNPHKYCKNWVSDGLAKEGRE